MLRCSLCRISLAVYSALGARCRHGVVSTKADRGHVWLDDGRRGYFVRRRPAAWRKRVVYQEVERVAVMSMV